MTCSGPTPATRPSGGTSVGCTKAASQPRSSFTGPPESTARASSHDPAQLIDVTATCIDVAGASYPTEQDGRAVTPLEGVSLRPLITGEGTVSERPMFWEHEGNRAVRLGKWKLVSEYGKPWELYDMEVDRTELHDLSARDPQHRRLLVGSVPGVGRAVRSPALGDPRRPGQVGVHRDAPRRQIQDPR